MAPGMAAAAPGLMAQGSSAPQDDGELFSRIPPFGAPVWGPLSHLYFPPLLWAPDGGGAPPGQGSPRGGAGGSPPRRRPRGSRGGRGRSRSKGAAGASQGDAAPKPSRARGGGG